MRGFLSAAALALAHARAFPVDPLDATPPAPPAAPWGPDPSSFSDNAVLASTTPWRGGVTPARLFGAAAPGEAVTISGLPAGARATPNPARADASGAWLMTVAAPDSLAPADLVFNGTSGRSAVLRGVRFGLTILCSGQSKCGGPRAKAKRRAPAPPRRTAPAPNPAAPPRIPP
jgi:hypothetical protein